MRFKSRTRAMAAAALAASVSLAGLTTVATPAGAAPADTDRVAGTTRYGTAAEAALRSHPNASTVVVTTGERVPDALSANPIAGENDAPILLVTQNSVPSETAAALAQIDPENVIIVGGTAAVSNAVQTALAAGGATVTREAGDDRFETAAEVARAVGEAPAIDADGNGTGTARPTVAIANGLSGLADAVSASPMLHQEEIPLLLTSGNTLDSNAGAVIDELNATQVILLGGTAAIPAGVAEALEADGIDVVRLGGAERFSTAAQIADFEIDFLGFDAATTFLANGFAPAPRNPNDLVDALAGGPLASAENGPILLVTRDSVPEPTAAWHVANAADIDEVIAIGGTAVISDAVLNAAAAAADENAAGSQVNLTSASVEQGGTITGTITGDVVSATVSGCGLSGQSLGADADTSAAGRQFTLQVPPTQNTGACTLTFTITDSEGETTTETESVTVTSGRAAGTATVRPELVSAQIVGTVTDAQVTPTTPAGTTIRYVFDEPVTGDFADEEDFEAYDFAGTNYDGDNAVVDPTNSRAVLVLFEDIRNATGGPQASSLTLASVYDGVVVDGDGDTNPIGDAPIGTAGSTTLAAGTTSAPDLLTVNSRGSSLLGLTIVDFTFDEAANVVVPDGFHLVLTDGSVSDCSGPAVGSTTPPSGTTSAGGNGTITISVVCENAASAPLTPIANASIARGYVDAGTVSDATQVDDDTATAGFQNTAVEGNVNPLQASNTPDVASPDPDLVSATFLANGTSPDQVMYTFDEPVLFAGDASLFNVYTAEGQEILGLAAQRSPTNDRQVLVTFDEGDLNTAVGANVEAGAVDEATGLGNANEADEVGVSNPAATIVTPGQTADPELTNVVLRSTTNNFGQTVFSATYVFDEDIETVDSTTSLVLYLADGTELYCDTLGPNGGIGTTEDTDNTVTCVAFELTDTGADATSAQVGSAVLGAAYDFAVAAEDDGDGNTLTAALTSGGTGTPTR